MSNPKLNIKEESSAKKTRSPPKKASVNRQRRMQRKLQKKRQHLAQNSRRKIKSQSMRLVFSVSLR